MLNLEEEKPEDSGGMSWEEARQTIVRAQERQTARQGCLNAHMHTQDLIRRMQQADLDTSYLTHITEHFELSMRNYHKLWRIALTLADLAWVGENKELTEFNGSSDELHVKESHLLEALSFRAMQWSGRYATITWSSFFRTG